MTATSTLSPAFAGTDSLATAPRPLWRAGVVSGLVGGAATCVVAAVAHTAGVPMAVAGERIPLMGFAQFTVVGALLGLALAKIISRRATHPRRAFVIATVGLVTLSIVPDVIVDATTATKAVLALTHLVAASIIVPAFAVRLNP